MGTEVKCFIEINNLHERALNYKYIICRAVEGGIWYYGADNDLKRANEVAKDCDGFIVINEGK